MKTLGRGLVAVALLGIAPATTALAAPPLFVSDQARAVEDVRTVQVMVAQSEIKTDINPSNLAVATGGGILGGLLAASQNASRAKKAEAAIEPVRTALTGFDSETLALETTRTGLAGVPWLKPGKIAVTKDSSVANRSTILDTSGTGQVVFVDYSYDLSPDFSSVRVVANIQVANRATPAEIAGKPQSRLSSRYLAYQQSVRGVVTLPNSPDALADNAALWSADGGKRIRTALDMAFRAVATFIPKALMTTEADIKVRKGKDKKKTVVGGMGGRLQEIGPNGTLLWADGYVYEQPLAQ